MGGGGKVSQTGFFRIRRGVAHRGPTFYSQSSTLTIPSPQEERQLEQGGVQITIVQSSDKDECSVLSTMSVQSSD
jgi:hypothetical protein